MRLQTAPLSSSGDQLLEAFCFAADAVGHAVYLTGNKVGDKYQITRVDIDDITTMPSIGIILEKLSATTCIVQTGGIIRDIYTGLTPQKPLFVGANSMLTHVAPAYPTAGRRAQQMMGQALATTELFLHVKSPIILVPH
jgi:hypothetical protein